MTRAQPRSVRGITANRGRLRGRGSRVNTGCREKPPGAAQLAAHKTETRELGEWPLPGPIAAFVEAEFAAARETFETAPVRASEAARERADAFFRKVVRQRVN